MKKKDIDEFYSRLAEANPEPESELDFTNPYTLLVAVVLSAQTTDAGVNKATGFLFGKADSPQKMLMLGESRLKDYIKSIGLFNNKARNIIRLSQILIEKHGACVPNDRQALEALPGVGRKTANVVLNIAFGEPTIAVDTHIFRLSNRTGMASGKNPAEVEKKLIRKTPEKWKGHAHHWLILHGRHVCKARKPNCADCVVRDLCAYKAKICA